METIECESCGSIYKEIGQCSCGGEIVICIEVELKEKLNDS